jgi:hypothetical protein
VGLGEVLEQNGDGPAGEGWEHGVGYFFGHGNDPLGNMIKGIGI